MQKGHGRQKKFVLFHINVPEFCSSFLFFLFLFLVFFPQFCSAHFCSSMTILHLYLQISTSFSSSYFCSANFCSAMTFLHSAFVWSSFHHFCSATFCSAQFGSTTFCSTHFFSVTFCSACFYSSYFCSSMTFLHLNLWEQSPPLFVLLIFVLLLFVLLIFVLPLFVPLIQGRHRGCCWSWTVAVSLILLPRTYLFIKFCCREFPWRQIHLLLRKFSATKFYGQVCPW